jgi:hypothetical protein
MLRDGRTGQIFQFDEEYFPIIKIRTRPRKYFFAGLEDLADSPV